MKIRSYVVQVLHKDQAVKWMTFLPHPVWSGNHHHPLNRGKYLLSIGRQTHRHRVIDTFINFQLHEKMLHSCRLFVHPRLTWFFLMLINPFYITCTNIGLYVEEFLSLCYLSYVCLHFCCKQNVAKTKVTRSFADPQAPPCPSGKYDTRNRGNLDDLGFE